MVSRNISGRRLAQLQTVLDVVSADDVYLRADDNGISAFGLERYYDDAAMESRVTLDFSVLTDARLAEVDTADREARKLREQWVHVSSDKRVAHFAGAERDLKHKIANCKRQLASSRSKVHLAAWTENRQAYEADLRALRREHPEARRLLRDIEASNGRIRRETDELDKHARRVARDIIATHRTDR